MAGTIAEALAEAGPIEWPNRAVKDWPRAAPSVGTTSELERITNAVAVAITGGRSIHDGQDAVQDYLCEALEKQEQGLFRESPRKWYKALAARARYHYLKVVAQGQKEALHFGGRPASLDGLFDDPTLYEPMMRPIETAPERGVVELVEVPRSDVERSIEADWSKGAIVAELRRWAEENGRVPAILDASSSDNDMPAHTIAIRYFGSWTAALKAAGLRPRTEKRRWGLVEASEAIYNHYRRTGSWPNSTEINHNPELPGSSALQRHYGSRRRSDMIEGVLRVMADPEKARAEERKYGTPGRKIPPPQTLAAEVKAWADANGRWPALKDFMEAGNGLPSAEVARKTFGTTARTKIERIVPTMIESGGSSDLAAAA